MAEAAQKRRKDFHRSGVRAGPRLLRHRSKIRVGTKDRAVWGVLGPFSFAQSLNPPKTALMTWGTQQMQFSSCTTEVAAAGTFTALPEREGERLVWDIAQLTAPVGLESHSEE